MEVWKKIDGFDYEVSNYGRIKSLNRIVRYEKQDGRQVSQKISGKILKPVKLKNGYLTNILRKDGKSYCKYIHRLVAEAFVNNPHNLQVINHKDRNRENNHVDNLEWCTIEYNVRYSRAFPVKQYSLDGQYIKTYPSMTCAEDNLGLPNDSIRKSLLKQGITHGYKWELEGVI